MSEVEIGGACAGTVECAKGLHCTTGVCAEPSNAAEQQAVEVAKLKRKIADTHRLEKAAFTEDGKRRMRKERSKLEAKLQALAVSASAEDSPTVLEALAE